MTNEKGKCYKQTPLFASFNTSSALHIFIFSVSYRPMRMSASTDADVCTDRCAPLGVHLYISATAMSPFVRVACYINEPLQQEAIE